MRLCRFGSCTRRGPRWTTTDALTPAALAELLTPAGGMRITESDAVTPGLARVLRRLECSALRPSTTAAAVCAEIWWDGVGRGFSQYAMPQIDESADGVPEAPSVRAGRATTAVHLAVGPSRRGPTLLLDTDPQGLATRWAQPSPRFRIGLSFTQHPNLKTRLPGLALGYQHVVLDTIPNGRPRGWGTPCMEVSAAAGRSRPSGQPLGASVAIPGPGPARPW